MKLILVLHINVISLYINCVFYSGWIRSLVAVAKFIFHRLTIRNAIFLSQFGYLDIFLQKYSLSGPLFHKTFVQIPELDWLPQSNKKVLFFFWKKRKVKSEYQWSCKRSSDI